MKLLGYEFREMTDMDRHGYAVADPDALIYEGEEFVLIYLPTSGELFEQMPDDTVGGFSHWRLFRLEHEE